MARRSLTTEQAALVKQHLWEGRTLRDVARHFSVSYSTVSFIKMGFTYRQVPWPDGSFGEMPLAHAERILSDRTGPGPRRPLADPLVHTPAAANPDALIETMRATIRVFGASSDIAKTAFATLTAAVPAEDIPADITLAMNSPSPA